MGLASEIAGIPRHEKVAGLRFCVQALDEGREPGPFRVAQGRAVEAEEDSDTRVRGMLFFVRILTWRRLSASPIRSLFRAFLGSDVLRDFYRKRRKSRCRRKRRSRCACIVADHEGLPVRVVPGHAIEGVSVVHLIDAGRVRGDGLEKHAVRRWE